MKIGKAHTLNCLTAIHLLSTGLANLLRALRTKWAPEFGARMLVREPRADVTDAQLLRQHPKYLPSLTRLARITGSTSDPYISREIIAKLKEGLEATGLTEEAEAEQFAAGLDPADKAPPSGVMGLLKRMMKVRPLVEEEAPAESPRMTGTMVVHGGADSPGSFSGSPTGSSPGKRRRASLANWSKGSPQKTLRSKSERADDLEC